MENPEGNNAAVRSLCCELRNESPKLPYAVGLLLTNNGNGAESLLGTLINVDPKVRYALGVLLTNGGTDLFGLSSNSRPTSVIETLLGTNRSQLFSFTEQHQQPNSNGCKCYCSS